MTLKRRLIWAVLASFLSGFLTFMSVTFQEISHYGDAIETCHELQATGSDCQWRDEPTGKYHGRRTGDDK